MQRIFLSPPHQNGHELELVQEVLHSNFLAPVGPMLDRLESTMRLVSNSPHCLALNTGTAALHLAIRHLMDHHRSTDPRPPVVIAASLSFIASVAPALHMGCEVWLTDVEEESWTLDPILLSHALTDAAAEGRKVLCVLPTDLFGQACDLTAIRGLCDGAGIPVLCDSAEALGVKRGGPAPWAQIFSFNGNKIITCSGGGILATHDDALAHHARKLSMQAREDTVHYEHLEVGYNYRLSNLLAGVAVAQLETLQDRVRKGRAIFQGYRERLESIDGISFMPEAGWNEATRWLTVIRVHPESYGRDREELRLALEAENIESRPIWKPLHRQPALQHLRRYGGAHSDHLFAEGLCLPSGTALTDDDLDRICGVF
ncbi:MAG: DegT/DnrJ/EryC1/StrS family aminotransferase [Kiritimatiellae bacterium]|jgi:dTDP-4-amino-4,6-dideoxygalactose transaminase|nr:DegT/DnrJ/EryC1/StrS family aminotransferase [Kiritimatiellia bacterium]